MKRFRIFLLWIAVGFLAGCQGGGSSAPAPTNVKVVAGDSSATVSWDMQPGVEYWVFKAAGPDVSTQSCITLPECRIVPNANSPALISGLTNGTTYSFTVNGRINGGKGGPGSSSVQAIPRLAGASWTTSAALGASDLHGVVYGAAYIAVGNAGVLYSSADGISWTALTNTASTANLNAITYSSGKYIAVGAGGTILLSTDGATWQQQTSGTINDLLAIATNGAGAFVATGVNGTLLTSGDGINWTVVTLTPVTASALYGVTYANGRYVAVGAAGVIFSSTDGTTWQAATSLVASDLKAVTYGANLSGTNLFVALGAKGAVLTSTDGISWVVQTAIAASPLINSVTYGHQFIAVDNAGGIYASTDGIAWSKVWTVTLPLYALAHGLYDYVTVGASGTTMHAM